MSEAHVGNTVGLKHLVPHPVFSQAHMRSGPAGLSRRAGQAAAGLVTPRFFFSATCVDVFASPMLEKCESVTTTKVAMVLSPKKTRGEARNYGHRGHH